MTRKGISRDPRIDEGRCEGFGVPNLLPDLSLSPRGKRRSGRVDLHFASTAKGKVLAFGDDAAGS